MSTQNIKAIQAINLHGALLVYPIQNKKEPKSLWSTLHPRSEMKWEWTDESDNKVADLWHLRMELSTSRKVVYAKWFQNRATFFSRDVFVWLLSYFGTPHRNSSHALSSNSQRILKILEMDSPLSTKVIKAESGLQTRVYEAEYNRAMLPLWRKLFIVGFGEIEDSSFPSLAVGSAQLLFEDLWDEASQTDAAHAETELTRLLGEANPFWRFARKLNS